MAPGETRISAVRRRLIGPLVVGCLTLAIGATWLVSRAIFVARATATPGVLMAIEKDSNSSVWNLTYRFRDAAGVVRTHRTWLVSATCTTLKSGATIKVLYDASSPENSKIDSFTALWFAPLTLTALGLVFSGGAYGLSRLAVRG